MWSDEPTNYWSSFKCTGLGLRTKKLLYIDVCTDIDVYGWSRKIYEFGF